MATNFGATQITIILTVVIGYIIVTTLVGIWTQKFAKTNAQFMTAGKQLPFWAVGLLLCSQFTGIPTIVGTAAAAFEGGIAAAISVETVAFAFMVFALFIAPKIYQTGEYTISGVMSKQYGKSITPVASLIMIYALLVVNVANFVGGAAAVSSFSKVGLPLAALIVSGVAAICVASGGLRAVAYVNLIHFFVKYLAVIIVVVVAVGLGAKYSNMTAKLPALYFSGVGEFGLVTIIAWTIANMGAVFSTQFTVQAVAGAKSMSDVRKACLVACVLIVPLGILGAYIGLQAKYLFPNVKSVMAFPIFIQHMNPWLGAIVAAGLVAAVLINVTSVTLATTALVMKDFFVPLVKPSEKAKLRITRIASIIIALIPIPFVLLFPVIIKTLFFAKALRTSLSVLLVVAFYLAFIKSEKGAVWALIIGAVGTSIWYFSGEPFNIDSTYAAVVLPAIVLILARLFFGGKSLVAGEDMKA